MDQFIDALTRYASSRTRRQMVIAVAGLFLIGAVVTAVTYFVLTVPVLPSILGALAGVSWFAALYLTWLRLLPSVWSARLNWRATMLPRQRRIYTAWLMLGWVALLVILGRYIAGPVLGTLNVAVAGVFWRAMTLTPAQRALALAEDTLPGGADLPENSSDGDENTIDLPGDTTK